MKEITLTRGFVAIVDDEDYETLGSFRWYAEGEPPYCYAARDVRAEGKRSRVYLHREVAGARKGTVVDHIDRNTLDNCRANLRVCTQSHNIGNAKVSRRNNKTGFKGVSWRPDKGKYAAQIKVNRKTKHLGFFTTAEAASAAYKIAAKAAFFTPH